MISVFQSRIAVSLVAQGRPRAVADAAAAAAAKQGGTGTGSSAAIPHWVQLDFAHACQAVFYGMAGIMAVTAVIAMAGLQRSVQTEAAAPTEQRDQTGPTEIPNPAEAP
jgi:hypothetical protein